VLRQVARRGVGGHFVVLDTLRGADQRLIGGGILLLFALIDDFLTFLHQTHHALARFRSRGLAEELKTLVDACDLGFRLGEMLLDQFAQLIETGRLRHLGQCFRQLLLRMQQVAELVEQ
jgi:hypothetical protein